MIGGWFIYIRVLVGELEVGIILQFLFLSWAFVFCCLTFSVPLFMWLEHGGCCVCFFVFPFFFFVFPFFFSLSLVPLTRSYQCREILCLLCKTILKVSYLINVLWISLEKGESFDFNHSLGCVYLTLYLIRILG